MANDLSVRLALTWLLKPGFTSLRTLASWVMELGETLVVRLAIVWPLTVALAALASGDAFEVRLAIVWLSTAGLLAALVALGEALVVRLTWRELLFRAAFATASSFDLLAWGGKILTS